MAHLISNKTFDEERALYNISDTKVENCKFAGVKDGESVLKECSNIVVQNCSFSLRYPMWHAKGLGIFSSMLDENTRAPLWYCRGVNIETCSINSIKCKN